MSNDTQQKDFVMRAPTLVPGTGTTTPSHFGALGCAYLETDEAKADEWTIVRNIGNGAYSNPVRVVAFNVAEGWSRDVTREIAEAVFELGRETLSSASSALLCSQRDEQSTGNPTVKGSSDVNITIPSEEEDALAESFQVE